MASQRGARSGLDEAERALAGALGTGEMAPFLGHHELPVHIARQLGGEIVRGVGRIESRLRLLVYFWPALTVAWIARTVAERYGTLSQMEIYPHLANLLGVPNLDPISRTRIARLFRHACRQLDLPLPEACEAVDAYVVQAGVPHSQIDRLADALDKAERRVDLPDIDDDLSVAIFTDVAADLVDAGHPRLRKVLEHDTVGWYARLWTTLRERPEDLPDDDAVACRLAECASAGANRRSAVVMRPCLAWRDGLLAVEIPEGPSRRWMLTAEGWRQEVAGQSVSAAVPLPLPWPTSVEWRLGGRARRSGDTGKLEPPSTDSVAVFASTGRQVTAVRFGALDEPIRTVRLPRGNYDLVGLTRFLGPEGLEENGIPGGWHLRLDLGTEPVTLLRGSRSATLATIQRPELELLGSAVRDLHGRAIYTDRGLNARVIWPPGEGELDESDPDKDSDDLRLAGSDRPTEASHELLVEIPDKELPPLPVDPRPPGDTVLDFGRHLADVRPVLRRAVLKLVRRGERRVLARKAGFVWIGLARTDGRRFVGTRPANLSPSACAHLAIDKDRIALPSDRPYAAARLVADNVDGKGRREAFEFAYPGLIAVMRWLDPDGVRREQVLEHDAVVALRPGDARLLEVSSPDPGATLVVGADVRPDAFLHRPRVSIPLAAVADACRGGADQLSVRSADGIEIALARFTVPCEVMRWVESTDGSRDERTLLLGFREPLGQLKVRARDLWHERTTAIELAPDGLRRGDASGSTLRLEPDHSGPGSGDRLVAELHDWPSGLWLCELEARLGDDPRWQALSNLRGDAFAWLVPHHLEAVLAGDLTSRLTFAERIQIFARCHKQLQHCFAKPCWEGGVRMVLDLWYRLAGSIAADERLPRYWPAILPLAFVELPLEVSESWLPLVSFWNVLPEFMALPGPSYANLRDDQRDDAIVLAVLADVAEAGSVARFLHRLDLLHADFFSCFANLAEVDKSQCEVEFRGFNLKIYVDSVKRAAEDDDGSGWSTDERVLSSSHYLTSFESLVRRYRTLTSGYGNAARIPGAARLVHDAMRWLEREGGTLAKSDIPDLALDGGVLAMPVPVDENDDDLLRNAPFALSAIALACRLEPRRRGSLDAFMNSVTGADRGRDKVSADLTFLTAAGRDLFAFWLLFWDVLLTTGERCKI